MSRPYGLLLAPLLLMGCRATRAQDPESMGSPARVDGPAYLQGLDPNGRIEKAELPEDLPNPDRWRYKPEGRISDGSVLDRFLMSTFIAPFFFFEGDVGTGVGVAFTDIDFRNKRRREFLNASVSYTTEGEQSYRMIWKRWSDQHDLEGGGIIQEERSFVQLGVGYRKTLTRRFFGLGPTSKQEDETSYAAEVSSIGAAVWQSFPEPGSDWVVGGGVSFEHQDLSDGFVSGVPNTGDVYPELFEAGDDLDVLWLHSSLRYDTRDSQSAPYRGVLVALWARGAPLMTDGTTGVRYGVRNSVVFPVASLLHGGGDRHEENPPTDVLAFVFDVEDSSGDLPFWALPTLGGSDRLRGYIAGRFVDQAAWFFGSEYRFVTVPRGMQVSRRVRIERFGVALFYELGSVAPGLSELDTAPTWYSYGVGGRLNLERAATFRADFGVGRDSSQFSLTYGLSF